MQRHGYRDVQNYDPAAVYLRLPFSISDIASHLLSVSLTSLCPSLPPSNENCVPLVFKPHKDSQGNHCSRNISSATVVHSNTSLNLQPPDSPTSGIIYSINIFPC